jgi:hypothetical protein
LLLNEAVGTGDLPGNDLLPDKGQGDIGIRVDPGGNGRIFPGPARPEGFFSKIELFLLQASVKRYTKHTIAQVKCLAVPVPGRIAEPDFMVLQIVFFIAAGAEQKNSKNQKYFYFSRH